MGFLSIMSRGGDDYRDYKKAVKKLKEAKDAIDIICEITEDMEADYSERGGYSGREHDDYEERSGSSYRRRMR